MKKTIVTAIILAILAFLLYDYFAPHKRFDTKPYDAKIDSLQKENDSLFRENDSLEVKEQQLEVYNTQLTVQAKDLKNTIEEIKKDNSHIEKVNAYTPTQVDSFFINRYTSSYKQYSIDTTHLPLPVSKAVVIDVLELDKTKTVLFHTDSLVNVQDQIINTKDGIITTLRSKETNYQSVIKNQVQQQENYKIQIAGLKNDLKRTDRSIKFQKVKTFVLGAAVIALAVTHK